MKRIAMMVFLGLGACGSDEGARPAEGDLEQMPNLQVKYREGLIWHGTYWTGDYFDVADRMLWAEREGTYLVGQEVKPADAEGRATFRIHARANDAAHWVWSKNFFSTRPAYHEDLRRGRWVYMSDTVLNSPKHMIEMPEPPKSFVENAKKEPWHKFFINNTYELQFGRIDILINEITHVVPTWALRVENIESK
jgi:hypothetical protein